MKFLFVSNYGEIVDICRLIQDEGNEVLLFIKDKELQYIGDGIVKKVSKVDKQIFDLADIIIFDDSVFGDLPLQLRKEGYKVIGSCRTIDELEHNRENFYRICSLLGIRVPKIYKFDKVDDAIKYIKRFPNQYVLKSYNEDKSLTIVSKQSNSDDLIRFLEVHKDIKQVFLQNKVKGYEVAISCFFNGDEFIPPLIVNYEHKKLGNNNTGVYTGEMGTVLFFYPKIEMKFFNETLKKLSSILKNNYVGIIDMNCIVNTSGVYALEITPRFGYPITNIMSSNIESWSDVFIGLVNKEYDCVLRNLIIPNGVAIGVVLSAISPFEKKNCLIGIPLININKETLKNFSIYGVLKKDDNYYVADKYLGVVHYVDKNINLAKQKVYSICEIISTPDLFYYRTDIGEKVLNSHKWLSGIKLFN